MNVCPWDAFVDTPLQIQEEVKVHEDSVTIGRVLEL